MPVWLTDVAYLTADGRLGHADLALEDGVIADVADASGGRPGALDCSPYVVVPGLTNAHFHGASTILRGLNVGLDLREWGGDSPQGRLQDRLFRWLDEEASYGELATLCRKEYVDLLRQGVTLTADSGFAEGSTAQQLADVRDQVGLRGCVDAYDDVEQMPATGFSGHLPEEEDLTAAALDKAARHREACDPIFTTHCLETGWRREKAIADWGKSSVQVFADRGLLGRKTVLFHGCRMDDDDIATVAAAGASVVHCPVSNLASTGLIAPTARWLDAGVNVALGTDFANTNVWEVLRTAWMLFGAQGRRGLDVPRQVLAMATRGGALAYGREDLGEIVAGRAADLIFLDAAAIAPHVDRADVSTVAHAILTQGRAGIVRHVMVGGRWVLRAGEPTLVDGAGIETAYDALVQRVWGPTTSR
jgi:5-methylthioadenosine/S-adenosylhomocysteine deaminase